MQAPTRCPGAKFVELVVADNYALGFSKGSRDGSGKATVFEKVGSQVIGALYEIPIIELEALDRAEGVGLAHYDRIDGYAVSSFKHGHVIDCVTYQAVEAAIDTSKIPYDWYLQLMVAGLKQHNFPAEYLAKYQDWKCVADPDEDRKTRMEAIQVLKKSGYPFVA